jgi:hypothetical protein
MLVVFAFPNLLILFDLFVCFFDAFTLPRLKKTKRARIANPPKL